MRFFVQALTDTGLVRQANEDSIEWCSGQSDKSLLAAVADGMGGYHGGAVASRCALDAFVPPIKKSLDNGGAAVQWPERLRDAATAAQHAVRERRASEPALAQMGTTLTAALFHAGGMHWVHAGDSRCYRLHDGQLRQLTRDDTVAQALLDEGGVEANDALLKRYEHILTTALGAEENIEFAVGESAAEVGDQFLLCSDGLYGVVDSEQLTRVLTGSGDSRSKLNTLLSAALDAGAPDNISVLLVSVQND